MGRHKRPRGGQPGNQNARKHGFYSAYMNAKENRDYLKALTSSDEDPDILALRIKLTSALVYAPSNRRVLREAYKKLYFLFRSKYEVDETEMKMLRLATRNVFKTVFDTIAESNEAESLKEFKKLTEPSKLKAKKSSKNDRTNRIQKIKRQIESALKSQFL